MVFPKKKRSSTTDNSEPDKIAKRPKGLKETERGFRPPSDSPVDHEGNSFWELDDRRRVTLTEFRKQTKVDIREFYEQGGNMLPGKKVRCLLPCSAFFFLPELSDYGFFGILNLVVGHRPLT
jgi:hypothetical protein